MTTPGGILKNTPLGEGDVSDDLAKQLLPGTVVRPDEPLARHTTMRVGGPADVYVEPNSEADLAAVLRFCAERGLRFFILGRGSNLLVRDRGFRGVVICLVRPHFSRIEVAGERLHCGAGARLKQVATEAKRHGLAGLEFLEGIPGSVGGALRMNAGAMGSATFDLVESVRVMDAAGQVHELAPKQMGIEYRRCATLKTQIALGAVFKGRPDAPEAIGERMNAFSKKRWSSQPAAPSAGCIFRNTVTLPAGRLVEELGLKGLRAGGAVVSTAHGNFIVNEGGATSRDVLELIEIIRHRAKSERDMDLQMEIEVIGDEC